MSQDILELLIQSPEEIFSLGKKNQSNSHFNNLVKALLDPIAKSHSVLDEIYVDGLDASQVYGQTKMVLEGVGESLLFERIPELKEKYGVIGEEDEEEDDEEDDEELEEEEDDEEDDEELEEEQEESSEENANDEEEILDDEFKSAEEGEFEDDIANEDQDEEEEQEDIVNDKPEKAEEGEIKKDVFGLNDGFFDIDEFNRQSLALENDDEEDEDDEEIDFFADLSDEEDDEADDMEYYDDFYDKPGQLSKGTATKPKTKKADGEEDDDEEEDEDNFEFDDEEYENAMGSAMLDLFDEEEDFEDNKKKSENLSSFEKQQREIQEEIAKLEAELVADKKWSMKGEVQAKDRPEDSLLDDPETHNLEFERTAKPVPVITQEITESIEDMIRRRIKEENFDDLPKRLVNDVSSFHNRQKFELSEQKSSKSLSELYEDDFNGVSAQTSGEISPELQKQHDEISELFASVTHKLDSLCSAHFIPKPHQFKQVEIKVNDSSSSAAASISMEDAQPLHISSDTALAPQEVYKLGDDKPKQPVGREGKQEVQLKSGLSYSKDELSREEKQRLRRASKRKRSKEFNQRKEVREQKEKQQLQYTIGKDGEPTKKKARVGEVIDTLSKAKNVTVIGKKGEMTDVKGQKKKNGGPKGSSGFKL